MNWMFVRCGVEVSAVCKKDEKFIVTTNQSDIFADIVIWAAGQFFYPKDSVFQVQTLPYILQKLMTGAISRVMNL